jgi:uncharacterized membrane protein YhfC
LPALHALLGRLSRFVLGLAASMLLHALVDVIAALYRFKLVGQELAGLLLIAITFGAGIPLYKYAKHRTSLNRAARRSTSSRVLYVRCEKDAQRQE